MPVLGRGGIESTPTGYVLDIGEGKRYVPGPGQDTDEALIGVVETLRVTRKIAKELMRKKGASLVDANEHWRNIVNIAHKIDESPEDVLAIYDSILPELLKEMMTRKPSAQE